MFLIEKVQRWRSAFGQCTVTGRAVLALVVIFFTIFFFMSPYQRGFNCSDDSIKNKFRLLMFPTRYLFLCTLLVPLLLIYFVERSQGTRSIQSSLNKYAFGFLVNLTMTEFTKRTFGRLRPNTYDFCHLSDYCPDDQPDRYIASFVCENKDYPLYVTNTRLSFYSGHSSLGSFAGTYLICFLHQTYFRKFSQFALRQKLLCICIDLVIFLLYLYPGYTQWLIKWHFASDVLTGFSLGTLYALLVFFTVNRA